MNIDFARSTLLKIKEFQSGIKNLITKYPNFDYKLARNFLKSGEKDPKIPSEIYDEITRLNEIRKSAIISEMRRAKAKSQLLGETIDESLLDGSNYTPFFEEADYNKYPSLGVYEFLSFYSPKEIVDLKLQQDNNSFNLDDDDAR